MLTDAQHVRISAARNGNTSVNVSDVSKPKRDTRAEIARETKVPERKLLAAAEVKKARRKRE
jgi:hypothetical protein